MGGVSYIQVFFCWILGIFLTCKPLTVVGGERTITEGVGR